MRIPKTYGVDPRDRSREEEASALARLPFVADPPALPLKGAKRASDKCAAPLRGYVVNEATGKKIPTGCMAWGCRTCARLLSYRVRKRLEPIEWLAKVEFTLDGDGAPTRENNLRLARGQRSVLQWVRRLYRRKYGSEFRFRYARMH